MTKINTIWIGMLTRNSPNYAGTDSPIVLIIDESGFSGSDRLQHTFDDTPQRDQERGQANLYELSTASKIIEFEDLTNTSIRIGIRGSDIWYPEHIFLWGELENGIIQPLAIRLSIETTLRLSTDKEEGNLSNPIRLINRGEDDMEINRLLMLMTTADKKYAGTNSDIELQIPSGGNLVVDFEIPSTPQDEQERGQANFYLIPVLTSFSKRDLNNISVRLRIKGNDKWLPESVYLFGSNTIDDRTLSRLVPLVHISSWPHGWMSTDSSEGESSIPLTLV